MIESFLEVAKSAGDEASRFIRAAALSGNKRSIEMKKTADFVTEIDKGAEQIILRHIKTSFPEHHILAEESGAVSAAVDSDYEWIIDPLDGTTNFIRGIPSFAVSIGLRHKTDLLVGVVIDVMREETFSAYKNGGAFLNDQPMTVSIPANSEASEAVLNNTLLATGIPFGDSSNIKQERFLKSLAPFMRGTMGVRRIGAAALDLAYVAAGRFDGFWEIGLSPWDIAAGVLLVREAGGQVGNFQGEAELLPTAHLLAANPAVFSAMQAKLAII